jgi:hypothetical protein
MITRKEKRGGGMPLYKNKIEGMRSFVPQIVLMRFIIQ